jgi:hypothetical protein
MSAPGPGTAGSAKAAHRHNLIAVRGMRDQSGSGAHMYHRGVYATVHSTAPAPVAEYEAWLAGKLKAPTGQYSKLTGSKLRRMVVMRRQGSSLSEIGSAVGMHLSGACKWLKLLPEGLAA